jgi:hypothetical protein
LRRHRQQRVFGDAEFGDASLQLDLSLGELLALRLGDILRLAGPAPS